MRYRICILSGALFVAAVMGFRLYEAWLTRGLTYAEAREGYVTHNETLPAVFARTEIVLRAAGSGAVTLVVPDGTRAQKGEPVARLGDQNEQYLTAPAAGLVCAGTDGLEEIFTPSALLESDLEELFSRCGGEEEAVFTRRPAAGNFVQSGGAAARIVDNLQPVWAYLGMSGTEGILKGDRLTINVDGTLRVCTVERVDEPSRGVVVSFAHYINSVTNARVKQVIWQKQPPRHGVVVPAEALFARGEELGVYVVESGIINFRRVQALDRNEILVCVDNLVSGYSVVTNPTDGLQGLAVSGR
jgi:hypothetical protein